MGISNLTIEIWEIIIVTALFLTIGFVSVNFNDLNFIKANTLSSKIEYTSFLIEDSNIETIINVDENTKLIKNENSYLIKVKDKVSNKKISNKLVKITQDKNKLILISN